MTDPKDGLMSRLEAENVARIQSHNAWAYFGKPTVRRVVEMRPHRFAVCNAGSEPLGCKIAASYLNGVKS